MKHVIYALIDPANREVRYVGRTSRTIHARLKDHIGQAVRGKVDTPLYQWMRGLLPLQPFAIILQEVQSGVSEITTPDGRYQSPVEAAEIKWIKRFRRTIFNRIDTTSRAYKTLTNAGKRKPL